MNLLFIRFNSRIHENSGLSFGANQRKADDSEAEQGARLGRADILEKL